MQKFVLLVMAASSSGCFQQPTDVTAVAKYKFQSFAGTTWKTREKTAIAKINQGFPKHDFHLITTESFDPSHPEYNPIHQCEIVAELPAGTCLRIDRLLKDNNNWGGIYVIAVIESGPHAQKSVTLAGRLLAKNRFDTYDSKDPEEWGVDTQWLEKAERP